MRTAKQDNRSTRRTKASIQNALLHALASKPIESITVQELIDHANVCRTTFYSYFCDIYDLLDTIESAIIEEVEQELEKLKDVPVRVDGAYPTITSVVRIYAKYADTIRLLNGPNGDRSFDARMQDKIYQVTRRLRAVKEGDSFNERAHKIYSCYVISGGISVINQLLAEKENWDPDEVGRILGFMASAGERTFLAEIEKMESL